VSVEFHTFSIVGRCPRTGAFGVAVATARPAVGAAVPWVGPNGAIATQAMTNTAIGREGLRRLDAGVPIGNALAALLAGDPMGERRQIHGVDRAGVFVHTGAECKPWCGHRIGDGFSLAGNLLTGPAVLEAMAAAFTRHPGAELGERLLGALEAGQAAGGDSRGRQSAALLVWSPEVRPHHNLRVDDHVDPVAELRRLSTLMDGFLETLRGDYGEGLERYRRPKV
jgi:uncharacterized Ntn-hydrolase superfamily protein